ncbi:MAG: S1 family peptidase [Myxococcales bacterium]
MHRRRPYSLLAAVLAAALASGCENQSPESATLGQLSKPIVNGTIDNLPSHAAVVYLDLGMGACTGTLITPEVVLTAAHCLVNDYGRPISPSQVRVGFGTYISSLQYRTVRELRLHSGYSSSGYSNDIGLLRLSQPVTDVPPIPALPEHLAITQEDINSTVFTYSGYGVVDATNPWWPEPATSRMKVTDLIDCYCDGARCTSTQCTSGGAPNTFCYDQQPGGPCSGDSGGPAFITRDGVEYVAGVTSYGDRTCISWGCSTKVDRFARFIAEFLGTLQPLGAACINPSDCQSGFCVDGVCCNTACSAGACDACSKAAGAPADGQCTALSGPCDDGNLCTTNDGCWNMACVGTPLTCESQGGCLTGGACDPATGACVGQQALPNGAECDDGNLCTRFDSCQDGVCQGGAPVLCESDDPCLESACSQTTGQCVTNPRPDGTVCDDSNPCTHSDACAVGVCTGQQVVCEAQDECHEAGVCDPAQGGCTSPQAADGTECSAGVCKAGACVASAKEDSGCGCATSPGTAPWMLLLAPALALLRRRGGLVF